MSVLMQTKSGSNKRRERLTEVYCNFRKISTDILSHIKPNLVFTAHEHHGFMNQVTRSSGKRLGRAFQFTPFNHDPVSIDLAQDEKDDVLKEIIVPTCSYRMGVKNMAFGLAHFHQDKKVEYYNLWLPKRFPLLLAYLVALIVALVLFCCDYGAKGRRRRRF